MLTTSYVFFALFLAMSIIHLFFCFKRYETARKLSKVPCVVLLAFSVAFRIPNYPLIYIGLLFGAIGDYFMIKKEKVKSLIAGISTFYVGHVMYALQLLIFMNTPSWGFVMFITLEAVLELVLIIALYEKMKYMAHGATGPGIAYFTLLGTMLGLSIIFGIITRQWLPAVLLSIGYALFISSDTYLLYSAFIKGGKRDDFYIMLTYLSAEALIACGLAVMAINFI